MFQNTKRKKQARQIAQAQTEITRIRDAVDELIVTRPRPVKVPSPAEIVRESIDTAIIAVAKRLEDPAPHSVKHYSEALATLAAARHSIISGNPFLPDAYKPQWKPYHLNDHIHKF